MSQDRPYNPLDIENLGRSIAMSMLQQPVLPLSSLSPFSGAGIYAIYYTGDHMPFPVYEPIATGNRGGQFQAPIYVGKAVPAGSRKGGRRTNTTTTALYGRLNDHKVSIEVVENLDVNDFWFRYLLLEDIWIPLGESLLIESSRPLWNIHVDGFGNHNPGGNRARGKRPRWDTIHPGRVWAEGMRSNDLTIDQIFDHIETALSVNDAPELSEREQQAESESDQQQEP